VVSPAEPLVPLGTRRLPTPVLGYLQAWGPGDCAVCRWRWWTEP